MNSVTIRVKKCRKGYKVQQQLSPDTPFGDIAHAIWPTKRQANIYANKILCKGDKLICTPIDFLSPSDRVRIENYQVNK